MNFEALDPWLPPADLIVMLAVKQRRGLKMGAYRIREVRILDQADGSAQVEPLREYERDSDSERAIIEQVRHFFELEWVSPSLTSTGVLSGADGR